LRKTHEKLNNIFHVLTLVSSLSSDKNMIKNNQRRSSSTCRPGWSHFPSLW